MTRDEAATVILTRVVEREGGIGQVPGESWVTRFGQTPQWLAEFGLPTPETSDDALANYRTWLVRTRLIAVCDYPDTFADVTVDFAVNAGHVVAIRSMQKALGVHVDGMIGPETEGAIQACNRRRIGAKVLGAKVRQHGLLVTGNPGRFARYAHGWANRDADLIETFGEEE